MSESDLSAILDALAADQAHEQPHMLFATVQQAQLPLAWPDQDLVYVCMVDIYVNP